MFKSHTWFFVLLIGGSPLCAQKYVLSYNKGNYEKALGQTEKAIDEDAKNLDAYLYKSLTYMHLATNDETKDDFKFGIESSLSTLRFLTNKDKQKTFIPAHQQQVDSILQTASEYAFQLYKANKLSRVDKMIDKLIELSPKPEHYFLKGKLLMENGDEEEAMKCFNAAAAKIYLDHKSGKSAAPYLDESFIALARSLYDHDEFEDATVVFTRALDIFKNEEVENACFDMFANAESDLQNYSMEEQYDRFLHNIDTIIPFVINRGEFDELEWSAVKKYYCKLADDDQFEAAGTLLISRSCGDPRAQQLITERVIGQTGITYSLQQKVVTNAKDELSILLKIVSCRSSAVENETIVAYRIDSLLEINKYSEAAKLLYNLKLISSNKNLLAQSEKHLLQSIKTEPDSMITTIDLYEIFQYFPDNKELRTLQQNKTLTMIDQEIRDKKFSEAGLLLRNQTKLYPNDASLRSLYKTWVIEDYKTNFLGSAIEYTQLGWTGSYDECNPGEISKLANQKFIQRLNYVRRLAGVPDQSVLRDEWNKKCQAAALMMGSNGMLSHNPGKDWKCFTDEGHQGAGNSNLSLGESCVDALIGQLDDGGVESVGHRRWILYPYRKVYGHGSTGSTMALWALGGTDANYPSAMTDQFETQFVAWPPEGFVPMNFMCNLWSFSLNNCGFESATVEMYSGNKKIECELIEQQFGYGQNTLVWVPADLTYYDIKEASYTVTVKHVRVYGADDTTDTDEVQYKDFTYTVTFIPVSAN